MRGRCWRPLTPQDAFYAAVKTFNLAEKYQTPVLILTDHHLATSYATVDRFDLSKVKIERGELLTDAEVKDLTDYKRHAGYRFRRIAAGAAGAG